MWRLSRPLLRGCDIQLDGLKKMGKKTLPPGSSQPPAIPPGGGPPPPGGNQMLKFMTLFGVGGLAAAGAYLYNDPDARKRLSALMGISDGSSDDMGTGCENDKAKKEKDLIFAAENEALECILGIMSEEALDSVNKAIPAQNEAVNAMKNHSMLLKKAMDNTGESEGTDGDWRDVTAARLKVQDTTKIADHLAESAKVKLSDLKEAIQEGRENKLTKGNSHIPEAESNLKQMRRDLNTAVIDVKNSSVEHSAVQDFADSIKKGKEEFKKELQNITPEISIKESRDGKISEEGLNSLIAHAHRRVEQLQRQLEEQKLLELQRTEQALEKQLEEHNKVKTDEIESEKEKMMQEFDIEKKKWESEARMIAEQEIKKHLSRQAAVHSDHLTDVLKVQRLELEAQYDAVIQEQLINARAEFNKEIASHLARAKGIEAAIEGRAEMEKKGRKAQELWLACQALNTILKKTSDFTTKPLSQEFEAIQAAGDNHIFVRHVIKSIPKEALHAGVPTQASLQSRFEKVQKMCRRVAMVDESNKSLSRYALSYIQSLFVFKHSAPFTNEDDISPSEVSTFVALDNAAHHMEQGNLIQAVRFMNLLKGEARVVASDWLKDARLLLMTNQAGDALLAHASASGLGALFS